MSHLSQKRIDLAIRFAQLRAARKEISECATQFDLHAMTTKGQESDLLHSTSIFFSKWNEEVIDEIERVIAETKELFRVVEEPSIR